MLFSPFPFSPALSFHLIFPTRCLCSCICNHNITSLGAAFAACVCRCMCRCTCVVVVECVCVCVHFEVLLGAARGLRSTLGFNGSPHHRSASSYLLPCRRAVASSRWLIREAGNIFQISPHPHTDTHTRTTHQPRIPLSTITHSQTHIVVCGPMFLSGPILGPVRRKYV